jgi:hypothetical protein
LEYDQIAKKEFIISEVSDFDFDGGDRTKEANGDIA